jgi:hypothetical protein
VKGAKEMRDPQQKPGEGTQISSAMATFSKICCILQHICNIILAKAASGAGCAPDKFSIFFLPF